MEFLHNMYLWHAALVHTNQLKPVLVQLTQHHPVFRVSIAYDLKYVPFDYYTHYDHIEYEWSDRFLGPHIPVYKWGEEKLSTMSPSTVTLPFNKSHTSQHINCILNKFRHKIYISIHKILVDVYCIISIVQNNCDIYSYWCILS